jgi:hypothetical protein
MLDYLGDFDGHDPIAPSIQFLGQLLSTLCTHKPSILLRDRY